MKRIWWGVGVVALAFFWLAEQLPDSRLHVVFCDVGQGDAILMVKGRVQVLMDTGPSAEKVLACLGEHVPFWDRELEVVVGTHDQRDHVGALEEVKGRYRTGRVLGAGGESLVAGEKVRVGGLEFEVLWPSSQVLGVSSDDLNEVSVVMGLKYGDFDLLLTGDIGEKEERQILEQVSELEVLKVAHHGSKYSSSEGFLEKVKPKLAVIQVGKNSYGHPTDETLGRLEAVGARVLRNDREGEIEVVSDGEKWWVED